jgi:hypothetical protein
MKEPAKIHNAKRPTHTNIEPIQRQQPTHINQRAATTAPPHKHQTNASANGPPTHQTDASANGPPTRIKPSANGAPHTSMGRSPMHGSSKT